MGKAIITDISELLRGKDGEYLVPTLSSDYIIRIYPTDDSTDYDILLLQTMEFNAIKNGFSFDRDAMGFSTAKYNGNSTLTFIYFAIPYEIAGGRYTLTSLIHYYYGKQLTERGTLRMKRSYWKLPKIGIYNLRTQKDVYILKNCRFTYPTFTPNPSSNDVVFYKTTVDFTDYDEFLDDVEMAQGMESKNTYGSLANSVKNKIKETAQKIKQKFKKSKGTLEDLGSNVEPNL